MIINEDFKSCQDPIAFLNLLIKNKFGSMKNFEQCLGKSVFLSKKNLEVIFQDIIKTPSNDLFLTKKDSDFIKYFIANNYDTRKEFLEQHKIYSLKNSYDLANILSLKVKKKSAFFKKVKNIIKKKQCNL